MNNFQPISLCNVAKALSNRFKLILDHVIYKNQRAFVLIRLIGYNVVIAYKCLQHINVSTTKRLIVDNVVIAYECLHHINVSTIKRSMC